MTTINFAHMPQIYARKRTYLVKYKYSSGLGTELIHVEIGTNGEEWLALKEEVEKLSWLTDGEKVTYNLCGTILKPDVTIDFENDMEITNVSKEKL